MIFLQAEHYQMSLVLILSFSRETSDELSSSSSGCWFNCNCLLFCQSLMFITSSNVFMECPFHQQRGFRHCHITRCLEDDIHHHVCGCWRRWTEKPKLYRHLLAWKESNQDFQFNCRGLDSTNFFVIKALDTKN